MPIGGVCGLALIGASLAVVALAWENHRIERYIRFKDEPGVTAMDCLGSALPRRRRLPTDRYVWPPGSPRPRVIVLSSYTPDIAKYADLSAELNRMYCEDHGLEFKAIVTEQVSDPKERHVTWEKIYWIKHVLEHDKPDFVFWIDSDAVFNRTTMPLIERFGPDAADISVCVDGWVTKKTNTGVMLLRNSDWVRAFLDHWWDLGRTTRWGLHKFHEQTVLDLCLTRNDMNCKDHIALFWPAEFNCPSTGGLNRPEHNFISHYMGTRASFRIREFSERLKARRIVLPGKHAD